MKRLIYILVVSVISICSFANGWLPPSEDIVVERFDVFLSFDTTHISGSTLSKRDSVFRYMENSAVSRVVDKSGRFAVWRMLPPVVMVSDSVAGKTGNVYITVENAPVASLPDTVKSEDGDISLPYSIWAKVLVTDNAERVIFQKDYGLLTGSVQLSKIKKEEKISQSTAIVGINEAVSAVRDDVYSKYGFSMCKDKDICEVPESSKYYTFLHIVNGSLNKFVDFYTYNDMLCQIFRLNYPYPFIPYDTVSKDLKSVEGSIIRENGVDGAYTVEFENGNVKSFSGYIYIKDDYGKLQKQKLNKLFFKYDKKSGEYEGITTTDGQFTRFVFPVYDNVTEWGQKSKQPTFCKTENIVGSFIKMKAETSEAIDLKLDLYGNIYVEGSTVSSIPFGLLKAVADSNSVKFPMLTSENHTEFSSTVKFNHQLQMVERTWKGSVLLEKDRGYNNYTYVRLDNCNNVLTVTESDEFGNPLSFTRSASGKLTNNMKLDGEVKIFDVIAEGEAKLSTSKNTSDGSVDILFTGSGKFTLTYDDRGNLVYSKIGNVQIIKNFNY